MAEPLNSPQPKVSRYRSQRQKAQQTPGEYPQAPEIPEPDKPQQEDGIARSRSRYHRKNGAADSRPATAHNQEQTGLTSRPSTNTRSPPPARYNHVERTYTPPSRQHDRSMQGYRPRQPSPPAEVGAQDPKKTLDDQYDSGVDTGRRQDGRPGPVPVSSLARSPPSEQPTIAELFPPPKFDPPAPAAPPPRMDGPPTSDQIRATKADPPRYMDAEEGESGGCFGLFKRKRGDAGPIPDSDQIARQPTNDGPQAILVGGGGVVPGTDAPVSAVNAGDRRVLLECGRSKMLFPVTPETTPVDLIRGASTTMSERIDVKSAVLLEYFGTVGVQRPMRRYEHIRDVMNSWDTDRQNSLILVDPGTGSSEIELSLNGAPRERPKDASWLMTYSQRPGKWEKRFITLKADGQITCQKDPSKPHDQLNVCHMSDFDIYTPTQEKLRKKIKPPKKLCFAIKSQQKSSMFESTQNFVHFFCSNDRKTADDFHDAIQGWRSWYLVHVMGEGTKAKAADEKLAEAKEAGFSTGFAAQGHRKMDSMDSHYQLGSFQPLINMDQFEKRPMTSDHRQPQRSGSADERLDVFDANARPARHASTRRKQLQPASHDRPPQLADNEPLVNLARQNTLPTDSTRPLTADAEFASTGLLGRSYSQRQRDIARPEPRTSIDGAPRRQPSTRQQNPPITDIRRNPSQSHHRTSSDLARGPSRRDREKPKPLIDLTPTYREPPQHNKKTRGHGHETDLPPGSLIEAATSPEDVLGVPSSTTWRGRVAGGSASVSPAGRARSGSRAVGKEGREIGARPGTSRTRSENSGSPFTGEGLLAGAHGQEGWGDSRRGRGVQDGSRARGPMVDLSTESQFAQGSLLDRR